MAVIDPTFIPVLSDITRGLRQLEVPFCLIGALVPELLLEHGSGRRTNDADVTVMVGDLQEFERLKERLAEFGFTSTRLPHRLQHRGGGLLDILPFGKQVAPGGQLELQEGFVINMVGFEHVVPNAVDVLVADGLTVPVTPVPIYVLLKLVAFGDRKAPKDLASVFHCLQHYLEDDVRRYELDHAGEGVPFEYTCAYLLGSECRPFLDVAFKDSVQAVTNRFDSPDADVVATVAREKGRAYAEPEYLNEIFQSYRWFRLGAGL